MSIWVHEYSIEMTCIIGNSIFAISFTLDNSIIVLTQIWGIRIGLIYFCVLCYFELL